MRKILVTAISGDIGNGILKILKKEDNILYGCDINEIAVGMDLVEVFWQSKHAAEDGYIDQLLEKCMQYGITHLIPVNEREIERISRGREKFEEKGIKLVIQEPEILSICLDKWKTAEKLASLGMDVPATYLHIEEARGLPMQWICKPRKSNGSKGIFIGSSQDEIRAKMDFFLGGGWKGLCYPRIHRQYRGIYNRRIPARWRGQCHCVQTCAQEWVFPSGRVSRKRANLCVGAQPGRAVGFKRLC